MFDLKLDGANRYIMTIDRKPYMLLVRPQLVINEENDLVELFLAMSVYEYPFHAGDTPVKVFHIKPGGQLLEHEEGGLMTGGPLTAIFRDDIIDLVNS